MQNKILCLKEEFYHHRNKIFIVFVFCMMVVFSFLVTSSMKRSNAANLSNFNPGNIISDAVMGNYSSMTVQDIQNFLSSKNKCDNRDYDLYLRYKTAHPSIEWHWEGEPYNGHFVCLSEERFGDGEIIGTGMTAAEVIYDAAQSNKINPQVLLVLLQKETSLITDKVPNNSDYRKATGYGCPDTAACDSKYYGFKNQVYRAAELFRYTLDHGYMLYPEGRSVYVGYHPSSSCGGTSVKIENRATAALYRYTPYQPNAASLNAGYGTGDVCSSYGNRNFYLYFTDWFGSTQAKVEGELADIEDGIYQIVAEIAPSRTLGVDGSNVSLAKQDDSDKQRWQIQKDQTTGYYMITNIATKQALSLDKAEPQMGTNVGVSNDTDCRKLWKIYTTSNGSLTFETTCMGGMVLDINGGMTAAGTNIQIWLTHGGISQRWKLSAGRTLQDGAYTIAPKLNTEQVLDLNSLGSNITTWKAHGAENQRWYLTYDPVTDYYKFTNHYTNKAIDATGGVMSNGTRIGAWETNNSCAQKWKIVPNNGYYTLISACSDNYAMTLNGSAKNGTTIILKNTTFADTQQWQITPLDNVLPDDIYKISPVIRSTSAIDIAGTSQANGLNIALWTAHGGSNQLWRTTYDEASNSYTLTNPISGKNLDVCGGEMRSGANIQLWEKNTTCAQKWYVYMMDSNNYQLVSTCDRNMALDLNGGNTFNGTNIQLWHKNNSIAQRWSFVK